MKEINLTVTLDEANLLLEGLGTMPYSKVYGLISKIQKQAQEQLDKTPENQSKKAVKK